MPPMLPFPSQVRERYGGYWWEGGPLGDKPVTTFHTGCWWYPFHCLPIAIKHQEEEEDELEPTRAHVPSRRGAFINTESAEMIAKERNVFSSYKKAVSNQH